jgi:hypothetical protein
VTNLEPDPQSRRATRLLILGAVLVAVGGAAGLIGMTLGALGAVTIARRRVEQMEVPPSELARRNWQQMKAAVSAGAGAWRDELATSANRGPGRYTAEPE